jgi:hypothetical protein
MIHLLRVFSHAATALKVTLVRGLGKPLANFVSSANALIHLRLNARACRDGFSKPYGGAPSSPMRYPNESFRPKLHDASLAREGRSRCCDVLSQ